jgi:hypothetical protein
MLIVAEKGVRINSSSVSVMSEFRGKECEIVRTRGSVDQKQARPSHSERDERLDIVP